MQGAPFFSFSFLIRSSSVVLALFAGTAWAEIGTVQFALGDVRIVGTNGVSRAGVKGTLINEGDTVTVGSAASAQLKMVDGGLLAIRPDTQMKFDEYKFSGREDGSERGVMSLLRGGFRTITGAIGRINKNNYRVNTPTATVGIRGTDHEIVYVPAGSTTPVAGATPLPVLLAALTDLFPVQSMSDVIDQPILLAQAGPAGGGGLPFMPPGTYDKVNVGQATLTSQGITVIVQPNQVGYSAPFATPKILPFMPNFLRATPPPNTAQAPGQQQGDGQAQGQGGQGGQGQQGGTSGSQSAPVRSVSVVDSSSSVDAGSSAALQSGNTSLGTNTAGVTPTSTTGTGTGTTTTSTTTTSAVPVTLTGSSGLNLNLTSQTITTGSGTSVPINQGGGVAAQADLAAAAAIAAADALSNLVTLNAGEAGLQLPTVISSVSSPITTAQGALTTVSGLSVNTALAISNAANVASIAAGSLTTRNAAATTYAANGTFSDPGIATPAITLVNSAETQVQSFNTTVQSTKASIVSGATTFGSHVTAGSAINTAVNTALSAANSAVTALTSLGFSSTDTANSLLSAAQTAASNAQYHAAQALSYQNAGNFTQAQVDLTTAQQQQAIALNALNAASIVLGGILAADAAAAGAGTPGDVLGDGTVYGYVNAAQAEVTAANALLPNTDTTVTSSPANLAQAQAAIVATNAPLAQYNNPAWNNAPAQFPRGTHFISGIAPTAGGFQHVDSHGEKPGHNVSFVLDGNKNLVMVRNSTDVSALGLSALSDQPAGNIYETNSNVLVSSDVTIKLLAATSGSEGAFIAPDKSVYLGRWTGGQVDINNGGTVVNMGTGGVVWGTLLEPQLPGINRISSALTGTANVPVHYPQQVVGTLGFTKVYSTTPFDGAGNLGSVTNAALSANLTAQTVNASVDVSFSGARNMNLSSFVNGVPITQNGFDAFSGSLYSPTIGCSNTGANGCDLSGYTGSISGALVGTNTITGGGMGYMFTSANVTGPYTDLITGGVAFSANATPTAGVNLTFPSNTNLRHMVHYPVTAFDSTVYAASIGNGSGVTNANTNYLFDAAGNLVRIQETPYTLFDSSTAVSPGNVMVPSTTNNAPGHPVVLSFGGTPAEVFDASASIGARFGRYQGGKITVSDLVNDETYFDTMGFGATLGLGSALWAVTRNVLSSPYLTIGPGQLTGQWHYTRIPNGGSPGFATAPTDNYGNVGTLLGARLDVDFDTMTVNPGLRVSFAQTGLGGGAGAVALNVRAEDVAIVNAGFNVHSSDANPLRVNCIGAGCAPGYGGRIVGNFTSLAAAGTTADGALLRYTFGNSTTQQLSGMVALQQGPEVVAPATPTLSVSTSYYYWTNPAKTFGSQEVYRAQNFDGFDTVTSFAGPGGNLLSAIEDEHEVAISGNTAGAAVTTLSNGISFGRYASASTASNPAGSALLLDGHDFDGDFTGREVLGTYHWIAAPNMWPIFASSTMSGTGSYSMTGHSATDQNNLTGSVSTATFVVNFDRQSVDSALTINMPINTFNGGSSPRTWTASVNDVRLDDGGGFTAGSPTNDYAHNQIVVNLNGASGFGQMTGQLTGALVNGATVSYILAGNDPLNSNQHEHVNGVVAFGNPTFSAPGTLNSLESYRVLLRARGTTNGFNATTGALNTGSSSAAAIDGEFLTTTRILAVDPNRTKFNSNGELIEFDGESVIVSVNGTCPGQCFTSNLPTRLGINASGSAASGAIPAMPSITGAATIATNTVTSLPDTGTDSVTGISWGRYTNGNFALVDRVTGSPIGGGSGNFQQGNVNHYLIGGTQSGPTVLPTSGTFNYTFVGGTQPTDNAGNVGVLNAAALVANFGTQRINVSVDATVNGRNFAASATNLKIIGGTGFDAGKSLDGSGNLVVNCTGCSAPQLAVGTAGSISGAFTGSTGQGAGIAYSMNAGGLTPNLGGIGTTMGGVAAFKR